MENEPRSASDTEPDYPIPKFFEFRLFYVRIEGCDTNLSPPHLTLHYIVQEPYEHLEINGMSLPDRLGSVPLHRTRIDREGSAVAYTSTDYVKINEYGIICDIINGEFTVASASVGKWLCDWKTREGMGLETDMRTGFTLQLHPKSLLPEFMRRKEGVSVHPSIEVYVAGCREDGVPVVITRTKPVIDHSERLLRHPNPFNRGRGGRRGRCIMVKGTDRRYYVMGRECRKSEFESSSHNLNLNH